MKREPDSLEDQALQALREQVTTRQEALDALENVVLGLACTDAYHERDPGILLKYVQKDVRKWIIDRIPWHEIGEDPPEYTDEDPGEDFPGLEQEIACQEENLRLWRKYSDDTWHDDPEYAEAARELAALKKSRKPGEDAG